MATKEDIMEQIVEEYLLHQGFFVRHNLKFLPNKEHADYVSKEDSNHSDIDVLGYHPHKSGAEKILAVTCKSWQGGFRPEQWLNAVKNSRRISGREAWKSFRELVNPKWSEAFVETVRVATGSDQFTYVVAVARIHGRKEAREQNDELRKMIGGNPIRILSFEEMFADIEKKLTTTLAATEVGRLIQMFRAARLSISGPSK